MGDVALHPAQVTETSWVTIFDRDQQLVAETRRHVFDQVGTENSILVAGHFPEPGFWQLVRINGRRYWQRL